MSLTNLLVPTYRHMLNTLLGLLDKAEKQKLGDVDTLLSARLAADMYPLAAQIRFAAFQAQEATFRLRNEAVPDWLQAIAGEGRSVADTPSTVTEARARIKEALSLLDDLSADALDAGDSLRITLEIPGGVIFDMTGEQYARDWALPQFYFYVTTAYAILRGQGIVIGKADYVPHMFGYLRPGSMPST